MGNSAHIAPEIHLAWHQLRFQDVVFDFSKQPTFELGILGYRLALMLASTNVPLYLWVSLPCAKCLCNGFSACERALLSSPRLETVAACASSSLCQV